METLSNQNIIQSDQQQFKPNLRINWVFLFFCIAVCIVLTIIIDTRSTAGSLFIAARYFVCIVSVLSLFMPVRFGVPIIFLILAIGVDATQSVYEKYAMGEIISASLWQFRYGPFNPSMFVAFILGIHILKVHCLQLDKIVKRALIWFVTVPIITGFVYGGMTSIASRVEILQDVRFAILLMMSIILFRGYLKKFPQMIGFMLTLFVAYFVARHAVDLFYWFTGFGSVMGGATRVSVGSTKGTINILLLFTIVLFFREKRFILGFALGLCSIILLVVYAGRLLWLTSVLGCILLFIVIGAKRFIIGLPIVMICGIIAFKILGTYGYESLEYASQRAESFKGGSVGNYLQRLDGLRYGELVNVFNTNLKRGAVLWGSGYSSYYTDDAAPFPATLIAAFADYSAMSGLFYQTHEYFSHIYLKHGLIGLFIISSLWLTPAWRCYKMFDKNAKGLFYSVLACFIAFSFLAMIQFYWTGQGLFICGFMIASLITISEILEENHTSFEPVISQKELIES
ncbi:MAG: hypothetical protein A2Y10_07020 [Planctomycetes bacterium GWF2_41_51]|nr:MAG: hypothetical protein A2Y10_07020 [Planctomycetes bacterium GWF2_41_51]HBG28784.1 hypothetical protein [Phycisphaerales bacterium]